MRKRAAPADHGRNDALRHEQRMVGDQRRRLERERVDKRAMLRWQVERQRPDGARSRKRDALRRRRCRRCAAAAAALGRGVVVVALVAVVEQVRVVVVAGVGVGAAQRAPIRAGQSDARSVELAHKLALVGGVARRRVAASVLAGENARARARSAAT